MTTDPAEARSGVAPLLARTERLDLDVDLLDVAGDHGLLWARGRVGFAGRGESLRIEVPPGDPAAAAAAVHAALATIDVDDEVGQPGTGPVALGALPFDPRRGGTLVVPELLVGRDDEGARWLTTVAPTGHPRQLPRFDDAPPSSRVLPSSFTVRSPLPADEWCRSLVAARDELRAGAARKVVLARELVVEADRELSARALLGELRRTFPSAMLYAAHGFVGATPELLVARTGDLVRSHPMAGTAPRSADPSTDARLAANLLASTKDRVEHRYTIDMVHETLLPWCSYLDEEAEPSIVAMANVQHLATLVEGRLSSPPASVVELMRALHPTPAVNGAPTDVALDLMARYEGLDRGCYGGPVGWVDAAGNGAWSVGIRGAQLDGRRARLLAGVGVVEHSDPEAELAETQAKFQAVLGALLRL
jgi:menaquinone-specific isochorismate synthase